MDCHALLQRIVPTQEPNLHLLHLSWVGRRVLYHWHHLGSPTEMVEAGNCVSQTEPEAKQIGELKTLLPPTGKQRKGLSQNLSFNFTGTENNSSNSVKKHSKPFNKEKMTVLQRLNKVTEHFDLTDREFKTGLRKLRDKKTKKSS